MSDLVADLAAQGRSLTPEERVRLLDLLLESLQPGDAPADDEAWAQEIARRVSAHERGEGELHGMDEVLAEARRLAP
ncbi:addiction module protein [Roseateles saccharophilus]|uniref:Putative addiction module component (TIGR02574 family) n=1 Tax=Roseateles saccharophilus TaxID=304 RepID=A0A4R3UK76_ROSSA|nr:addiction module protein [Roseateles saccharophilus]MDG0834498.1 addiction module antitoxin RelB [Roseateles saccharophilus]TCU89787.1 putative addiction module component (TIGR02574 family) [Roseateles saccharophilus]